MTKVFISGSMGIKYLDSNVLARINNIIHSNYQVIIGDASGVDSSIQQHLSTHLKKARLFRGGTFHIKPHPNQMYRLI